MLSQDDEKYKELEEVKSVVKNRIEVDRRQQKYSEWMAEIKKNINIVVYKNKLKNTFSHLIEEE